MNEHVKYGLNLYLADTDPRCAILLKGDWGCGKTHFIKEWINEHSQVKNSACDIVYVSLFGLSSIKGLKDSINKAISPILYNVEKYSKDFLKAAAKIVLKFDTSVSNIDDAKFQYELNPLDLLFHLNLSENSKEYKLFIFDDIERCDIPLKELFGFIDYLFEQVGCRVILVVGNTNLQKDDWKATMQKYQEKVIGREYDIAADVNAAVSTFIEEIGTIHPSSCKFLKHHQDAIEMIWNASGFKNLRSIRQCIRSFSDVFESLDEGADDMKFQLFANYLAYSLEYYNGDKSIFPDLSVHIIGRYFEKDDSPSRRMIDKYNQAWQKLGFKLFDIEYIDEIKASVLDGKDITTELNRKINAVVSKSLSVRLKEIMVLENHDVDLLIREAKTYVKAPVSNINEYLYVVYILCSLENQSVCVLKKSFEKDCLNKIVPWIKANFVPSQLAQTEMQIRRGLSVQEREQKIYRFTWLSEQISKVLSNLKAEVKEPIFNYLEKLSDNNIDEVVALMFDTDVYSRANYSSQSLFCRLNVRKFCQRVKKLNNKSKMKLAEALDVRYGQNYKTSDYKDIFGSEESAIKEILSTFDIYRMKSTKITRVAYGRLIEPFNHALTRLQSTEEG